LTKHGINSISINLYNEFNKVGWLLDDYKTLDMFDKNNCESFHVHLNCYKWSNGLEFQNNSQMPLNIDKISFESLTKVILIFLIIFFHIIQTNKYLKKTLLF
jgi:hypothetical protein